MKTTGYVLLVLAAPVFVETAFEMYILTFLQGPQMLGFALTHTLPLWVLDALIVSFIAFYALALYSLVVIVGWLVGKRRDWQVTLYGWVLLIQLIHVVLLETYSSWAKVFAR